MKIPPSLLDDIRDRISVSDVVGRKVKLRRHGREYMGLSPFNKEKTPSFTVNDQKQFYHCFSSGKHGDVFKFLMETEGLSFPEAVERLAGEAGIALPSPDPQAQRREQEKASLYDVMEMATKYFQLQFSSDLGLEARRYANGRGLTAETLSTFRFGFAVNSRDHLKSYLLQRGVSEADMLATGLVIKPDDGRPTYDRFRNRLMIPIEDERGRVVAFGGRILDPDGKPKYLNSPETKLFHKGYMLFNAKRARQAAYEAKAAIVTEGYMDVIALHQAGIPYAVASLGTAFTEHQIAQLWKLAPEPYICFDGDRAGRAAANRAIERILPQLKAGFSFQFAFMPEGQDPDDVVKQGGSNAFHELLAKALPLSDVVWQRELNAGPTDTPERKAALEKRIEDLLRSIQDERVARQYQMSFKSALSNHFWLQSRQQREQKFTGGGARAGRGAGANAALAASSNVSRVPEAGQFTEFEENILGLCVHMPSLFEDYAEQILSLSFHKPGLEPFKQVLAHLILDEEVEHYSDIYAKAPGELEPLLQDLHGKGSQDEDGKRTSPFGWRLASRSKVPQLAYSPGRIFLERLMSYWLSVLEVRDVQADLEQETALALSDCDASDAAFERIQALTQEVHRRREENAREDQELTDEYAKMKSAGVQATLSDCLAELAEKSAD
ncbi:DNA primase [Cohaesibacter gelatinilyticus]|uniref:DNA primase n=1 Tax=Cohaesibacter gelatinilyticus TaxID=372072 RepID=A0A285PGF7_9HYPH|nr:DNA primase [Cohaesibacter gelatinilyticus]SNZ20815.1 DNA primase [Cohaesibacter gelatinilyticus]